MWSDKFYTHICELSSNIFYSWVRWQSQTPDHQHLDPGEVVHLDLQEVEDRPLVECLPDLTNMEAHEAVVGPTAFFFDPVRYIYFARHPYIPAFSCWYICTDTESCT